jgi:hypothetical protein
MAAKEEIHLPELKEILGRAIRNKSLRDKLLNDPEQALRDLHYEPNKHAVEFFKSLDKAKFDQMATRANGDSSFKMGEG